MGKKTSKDQTADKSGRSKQEAELIIPAIEETINVGKVIRETGKIRVTKTSEEALRERAQFAKTAGREAGGFTIPVIEEEIQVGKRDRETGGIRVTEHVSERPVEEEVRLRDGHVKVDRKRVDRPVTDADMRNMKDQTIELTEHHEEPVISKQARVKEELRISKDATERTERVRDTVKKTDVDVEKIDKRRTR